MSGTTLNIGTNNCRTCLTTNFVQFKICEAIYSKDEIMYLSDMLNSCTDLQFTADDAIELQKICRKCFFKVHEIFSFRKKCNESNEWFRSRSDWASTDYSNSSMCRTCLSEDSKYEKSDVFEFKSHQNQILSLASMIEMLYSFTIEISDNLPRVVCKACFSEITSAFIFRQKCRQIDTFLRNPEEADTTSLAELVKKNSFNRFETFDVDPGSPRTTRKRKYMKKSDRRPNPKNGVLGGSTTTTTTTTNAASSVVATAAPITTHRVVHSMSQPPPLAPVLGSQDKILKLNNLNDVEIISIQEVAQHNPNHGTILYEFENNEHLIETITPDYMTAHHGGDPNTGNLRMEIKYEPQMMTTGGNATIMGGNGGVGQLNIVGPPGGGGGVAIAGTSDIKLEPNPMPPEDVELVSIGYMQPKKNSVSKIGGSATKPGKNEGVKRKYTKKSKIIESNQTNQMVQVAATVPEQIIQPQQTTEQQIVDNIQFEHVEEVQEVENIQIENLLGNVLSNENITIQFEENEIMQPADDLFVLYKCPICFKYMQTEEEMQNHIKTYMSDADNSVFVCKYCSFSTRILRKFQTHYASHIEKKPFECDYCSKSFKLYDSYTRHVTQHVIQRT